MILAVVDPGLVALIAVVWIVVLAGGAYLVGGALHSRRRLPVGQPVIVVTTAPDDRSFHGVVGSDDGVTVVLHATHLLADGRDPVPIGDVTLKHERISFAQLGVAPVDVLAAPERPAAIPLPDTSRPTRLREAQ